MGQSKPVEMSKSVLDVEWLFFFDAKPVEPKETSCWKRISQHHKYDCPIQHHFWRSKLFVTMINLNVTLNTFQLVFQVCWPSEIYEMVWVPICRASLRRETIKLCQISLNYFFHILITLIHTERWFQIRDKHLHCGTGEANYKTNGITDMATLTDHCTSVSDVAYRQRLRSASIVMKSLFHGTGSVPMDVGHWPLLARLSGTLCPRTCVIRMFLRTVTGRHWRRYYFRSTSVFQRIRGFFNENALYKFTFDIDIDIDMKRTWFMPNLVDLFNISKVIGRKQWHSLTHSV